jgi:hypothetical protein
MPTKILADRAADPQGFLQRPGKCAHDRRQDAPVEQERGEHAHDEHDRQCLKCENELAARRFELER